MLEELSKDRFGIGWSAWLHAKDYPELKVLAIAEKEGGPYVPFSEATVRNRSYPLKRDYYIYVNKPLGRTLDPRVREFLRFCLSREGQQIIQDHGVYNPMPVSYINEQLKKLDTPGGVDAFGPRRLGRAGVGLGGRRVGPADVAAQARRSGRPGGEARRHAAALPVRTGGERHDQPLGPRQPRAAVDAQPRRQVGGGVPQVPSRREAGLPAVGDFVGNSRAIHGVGRHRAPRRGDPSGIGAGVRARQGLSAARHRDHDRKRRRPQFRPRTIRSRTPRSPSSTRSSERSTAAGRRTSARGASWGSRANGRRSRFSRTVGRSTTASAISSRGRSSVAATAGTARSSSTSTSIAPTARSTTMGSRSSTSSRGTATASRCRTSATRART